MTPPDLEQRVTDLERVVSRLQKQASAKDPSFRWWREQAGRFENDPVFEEIVRLGREYRESLRPPAEDQTP